MLFARTYFKPFCTKTISNAFVPTVLKYFLLIAFEIHFGPNAFETLQIK